MKTHKTSPFTAVALALGLSGTGVQAQGIPNPADQTGWETQARAAALIKPPNIQNLHNQKDALLQLAQVQKNMDGVNISAGPYKTPHDIGARISLTGGSNQVAGGLEAIKSKDFQSLFAALGFQITPGATGTLTISAVSESAKKALQNNAYSGHIEAVSASARLDFGEHFVRFLHEKGLSRDELARSSIQSVSVSEADFDTFIRKITTTTTTTQIDSWKGDSRNIVTGGGRFNITDATQLNLQAGVTQDRHGTHPIVGATLSTVHSPDLKTIISGYAAKQSQVLSVGAAYRINPTTELQARVMQTIVPGGKNNTSAFVGLNWSLGGNQQGYAQPKSTEAPTARQAVDASMADPTLRPKPSTLGTVEKTTTVSTNQSVTETDKPPQALTANALQLQINADGTVSLTLSGTRPGFEYQYQLDNSGTWTTIAGNTLRTPTLSAGITLRTPTLSAGSHTLAVREVNPRSGQVSTITERSFIISEDSPTQTLVPAISDISTSGFTCTNQIADTNKLSNLTCIFRADNGQTYQPTSINGNQFVFTGLPASGNGLSGMVITTALAGVKNPDGSISTQLVETRTPIQTLPITNTPPVANPDSATVTANQSVSIPVLNNDTDVDDNPLSIASIEQPASGGTVTQSGNNLVFTSDGTAGTYTFRYWVYDGQTNSLTPATVTVTVNAAPAIPPTSTICANQTVTLGAANYNCTFSTNSLGAKTWSTSNPAVATVDTNGTITYVGVGTATITVSTAATPTHLAESKQVSVTVNALPDPAPVSASIGIITVGDNLGMPTTYTLPAVIDSVGRLVTCTISGLPSGFSLAADNRTLNIVADVGGPTPFSGSRICDAGAPGNTLIQTISGTLVDE